MSRFPSNVRFEYLEAHHSNFTRGTWPKDHIVLHWWGDPATRPTFDGVVSWFRNPTANVSIQYMVEANRITQMIPESAMAWHSGNNNSNRHGIGIEVNPRLSAGDYETAAVLVAEIWKRRGKLKLRRHRDVNRSTACPGHMDISRIQRRAEQLYSGSSTPASSAPPTSGGSPVSNWPNAIKSHITGNMLKPATMLQDVQRKAHQTRTAARSTLDLIRNVPNRVWWRERRSLVTGDPISLSAVVAWSQYHSTQANHKVDALAATLDEVLDGQGRILKAVKDVDSKVDASGVAQVAARLGISEADARKLEDDQEED